MVKMLMGQHSPIGGGQAEAGSGSFTDSSGQARFIFWPRAIICKTDFQKQRPT